MSVPVLWRNRKQNYCMQGQRCTDCAAVIFPPQAACPHCRNSASDFPEIFFNVEPPLSTDNLRISHDGDHKPASLPLAEVPTLPPYEDERMLKLDLT